MNTTRIGFQVQMIGDEGNPKFINYLSEDRIPIEMRGERIEVVRYSFFEEVKSPYVFFDGRLDMTDVERVDFLYRSPLGDQK